MKDDVKKMNPAGLILSGPGMNGSMEGPVEIMFAGLLGALAGFTTGLLFGVLARVFTLNRVKGIIGGHHWAAYGAGAGALGLAAMELMF